ncbi:MAG: CBS domain-containing protein, partial [Rickettsiales bacterium]|nr:CBS domain-containing protein [Rickettsiales bacterium]
GGEIADGDFKSSILQYDDILNTTIADVMSVNPITINENKFVVEAASVMQGNNKKNRFIQTLFVLNDNDNVVGILHIQQLMSAGVL